MRLCIECGNDHTYIDKYGYARWSKLNENWYCSNCYRKIWKYLNPERHKQNKRIQNKKRMRFLDKIVYLSKNPRIGVCNLCRNVAPFDCTVTHMHHEIYNKNNTLESIIELCPSCHGKTKKRWS